MKVKITLKERLQERNIGQRQFSKMTGLSVRTINELVNNKTLRIPVRALERIAFVLEITNISELLTIVDDDKDDGNGV
ncbi:helix-turn-helix domain-containing protein [Lentibacillus daqui]|uniref:helix-turn-helix domain-containing protein n=1 Tax=Lentibacillus daqui TaxID=2911514 RepID=UPI0022B0E7BB|nr:helix-turn-helix transcriptional regulator [Lentibacillus daqui]